MPIYESYQLITIDKLYFGGLEFIVNQSLCRFRHHAIRRNPNLANENLSFSGPEKPLAVALTNLVDDAMGVRFIDIPALRDYSTRDR
jgi:hypothetical protein